MSNPGAAMVILSLLRYRGPMTEDEIAQAVKVKPKTIRKRLRDLEDHYGIGSVGAPHPSGDMRRRGLWIYYLRGMEGQREQALEKLHKKAGDDEQPLPRANHMSRPVFPLVRSFLLDRPYLITEDLHHDLLHMLRQRTEKGVQAYGVALHTHNGRDVQRDLVEELADAIQYGVQQLHELIDGDAPVETIKAARDVVIATVQAWVAQRRLQDVIKV